jgi:hypothetical protein
MEEHQWEACHYFFTTKLPLFRRIETQHLGGSFDKNYSQTHVLLKGLVIPCQWSLSTGNLPLALALITLWLTP